MEATSVEFGSLRYDDLRVAASDGREPNAPTPEIDLVDPSPAGARPVPRLSTCSRELERQPVRDLRQPRRVPVALAVEQLEVRGPLDADLGIVEPDPALRGG